MLFLLVVLDICHASRLGVVVRDLKCHSISPSVTDSWCQTNCNHVPPNCPSNFCKCDAPKPKPSPSPHPPSPGPAPAPSPPSPSPPAPPLGKKAIIGYWGSAADKPELDQLPEALKRGYNVISKYGKKHRITPTKMVQTLYSIIHACTHTRVRAPHHHHHLRPPPSMENTLTLQHSTSQLQQQQIYFIQLKQQQQQQ